MFIGFGTVVNCAGIVAGGAIGMLFRAQISHALQEDLVRAMGLVCLFLGIFGAVESGITVTDGVLQAHGTFMVIGSLLIGNFLGYVIGIDRGMRWLGETLQAKFGRSGDADFVRGFVITSLTVSIGAMAVVGAIRDGLSGDTTILMTKAVIDCVVTAALAASLGRGCLFAAIPVALIQGSVTVLARLLAPVMTDAAVGNLSLVGSMMIFCIGVNLIWEERFKVADMLPALVVAAVWATF